MPVLLQICLRWMNSSGVLTTETAQQFAQHGLVFLTARDAVQEALSAYNTAAQSRSQANLSALSRKLRVMGAALTAAPIRMACNSPSCSSVSGSTELSIVKGSGKMCSGCRAAYYCCKACQSTHWRQHKPVCKAMAAAAGSSSG
jgi:hypothetical protein